MDNKTIVLIGLGVLAFYMLRQNQPRQYPPAPVQAVPGSHEWVLWVTTILQAAGGLAQNLFGPGGPFHNQDQQAIISVAQQGGFNPIIGMAGQKN